MNVALHDVEPDSTAGDLADRGRRREAGRKHQLVGPLDVDGLIRADKSALHRHRTNAFGIDAPPVVAHVDHDRVPLLIRGERHAADRRLPEFRTLLRRLDAMVERIADDVHQRVGELLDHHLVELRVLAAQHELDFLVQLARDLADRSRELREDLADRHHPHLDHRPLHLVQLAIEVACDFRNLPRELLLRDRPGDVVELRPFDVQLADDVHDVIEPRDIHAHGLGNGAKGKFFVGFVEDRPLACPCLARRGWRRDRRGRLSSTSTQIRDLRVRHHRRHCRQIQLRPVQQPERNPRAAGRIERRQRRDHFAAFAECRRDRAQLLVEVGKVERHLERQHVLASTHVLDEAMLFILGQRPLRLVIEPKFRKGVRTEDRGPGTEDGLMDATGELRDVDESRYRWVADRDDEAVEAVHRVIEQVDEIARDRDLPHPQLVEHVLEVVRQLGDLAKTEHAGQALERVHVPKDLVDKLGPHVLTLSLEMHQVSRQRVENLLGFAGEFLASAIVVSGHATRRILRNLATSSPDSNGFTRYSSAPSAEARLRSASVLSVEITMIGMVRYVGWFLRKLTSSSPLMSGMLMSVRMASNLWWGRLFSASNPLEASTISRSYDSVPPSMIVVRYARIEEESSTTRIFMSLPALARRPSATP